MGAQNAISHFKRGTLVITPGDREDIILAAAAAAAEPSRQLAGMVLTEKISGERPLRVIEKPLSPSCWRRGQLRSGLPRPQSHRQDAPGDTEKISVIRDIIAAHVDVNKILRALKL
jgi:BioD-like phosphotransacetylase family protein